MLETPLTVHADLRSQDLVATVQIDYHYMPKLIFGRDEWEEAGGYHQILRDYKLSPKDIKKVERTAMTIHDFATLGDWEA
jgi:hypothetical protein